MFSLFNNTPKRNLNIILDIQSGLVRGAIVEKDKNGVLHIIYIATESNNHKVHYKDAAHLTKDNLKLVEHVVHKISKELKGNTVHSINHIFSSPWVFSKMKTIVTQYPEEVSVNAEYIENIVKEEFKKDNSSPDSFIIDRKIFEVRLNGYVSNEFEGKQAHKIEISQASSVAHREYIDRLKDVTSVIQSKKSTYNSALLLQFIALRSIFDSKDEYVYVHTHSELTDMVVVKNGQCKNISSFPIGLSTILRKISNSTKGDIESTKSLISIYQDGKLSEAETSRLNTVIAPIAEEWVSMLKASISSTVSTDNIPKTIHLTAHNYFPLFKSWLNSSGIQNLNIVEHDMIKFDSDIVFEKYTKESNMVHMYAIALHDVL